MFNFISFRSIQKLRFFLAGVFPFLIRPPTKEEATFRWLARFPRLEAFLKRVRASALGANAERVASTFALGNYASDTLDWSKVPRDAAAVLRAAILIGGILCLLVPLAMTWTWLPLSAEAITGTPGEPVAGWSVVLWVVAFAFGWSAMLAGTAASSRATFIPSLVVFLYFSVAVVAAAPKAGWSLLVPLQASIAMVYCEARARNDGWLPGLASCTLAGVGIAFVAIIVAPTSPWFRGRLLMASIGIGVALGVLLWLSGRALRHRLARGHTTVVRAVRLDVITALLVLLHLVVLTSLAFRGGLEIPAGGIQAFAIQMTGYLWPLYFFIGIGVVFKVLRQTKAVHGVVHELVPSQLFIPVTFVLLVMATIVPWIEPVLTTPAFPWPGLVTAAADWVYNATAWIWAFPLARFTMETMKWVLLGAVLASGWALYRRRLTSGMMAGLLFTVTLAGLAVFEYHFELLGFSRSPRNSALSLFIFTIFVLWLAHKTMLKFLIGSSPWWPPSARVATYAAALIFVLLPIHARAAAHSQSLTNEIFLYLFSGVINFGLPYYLYVYATKRFKRLPITVPATLGYFCLGAVLAVPLVLLDKVVVAGSLNAAWQVATNQTNAILQGLRQPPVTVFLPAWWIVVRGVLAMAAVVTVGAIARRMSRDPAMRPATVVFSLVAVAAGLACFSNRSLELPLLPQRVLLLITPLHQSPMVDAALVVLQLRFLLPALILALILTRSSSRPGRIAGVAAALLLHIGAGLIWPAHEAWLRSTGALFGLGAAAVTVFLLLAGALRGRLDTLLDPVSGADGSIMTTTPLLEWRELRAVSATLLVVIGLWTAYTAYAGRLIPHRVSGVDVAARLPAIWREAGDSVAGIALNARSWSGSTPSLTGDVRPFAPDSVRSLLQGVAMEMASEVADYEPVRLEGWDHYYPGALALDFKYHEKEGDPDSAILGTTAVAPIAGGEALVLTLSYSMSEPVRRWDLIRALQALRR
ncbi:MAG: hypothetical protein ACT4OZ_10980 [Gemmatimonadota bacterium]